MKRIICIILATGLLGCGAHFKHIYEGNPKPEAELAVVRTWNQGILIRSLDDYRVSGTDHYLYLVPGEHEFNFNLGGLKAHNLICGLLCDEMFDKNISKYQLVAGHTYIPVFDAENEKIEMKDMGTDYNLACHNPYRDASLVNCE